MQTSETNPLTIFAGQGVVIPRPEEVRQYLSRYPDLQDPVGEICGAARLEFGAETELSLELYRDPEFADHYLTLYVRPSSNDTGVLQRIDRIANRYSSRLENSSGYMLVMADFRKPGHVNGV